MADPIVTSVYNQYATHSESILTHEITFEQTKRSFSTAEFTCSATHKIRGELTANLDFYIFNFDAPIFNFADMCIVIGAFMILYTLFVRGDLDEDIHGRKRIK